MTPPLKSRPILTVLRWQAIATLAIAAAAGLWAGPHAALSAALGGLVTLSSTMVYAFVLGIGPTASAGASIVTMLRVGVAAPTRGCDRPDTASIWLPPTDAGPVRGPRAG